MISDLKSEAQDFVNKFIYTPVKKNELGYDLKNQFNTD
jgi:hypothetical protein